CARGPSIWFPNLDYW
nr:immunoglobulin heavy chain junction region [Macaca mulatta]MOY26535.1 immunoglobulin heavy chain junction region [Macaca mulatta]MOY30237.1 immunoglobulin heavy chain junction region [Macaca mulatta]